jgi:hypothetical protein
MNFVQTSPSPTAGQLAQRHRFMKRESVIFVGGGRVRLGTVRCLPVKRRGHGSEFFLRTAILRMLLTARRNANLVKNAGYLDDLMRLIGLSVAPAELPIKFIGMPGTVPVDTAGRV